MTEARLRMLGSRNVDREQRFAFSELGEKGPNILSEDGDGCERWYCNGVMESMT